MDNRQDVRSGLRFMISYGGRPGSNVAVSAAADSAPLDLTSCMITIHDQSVLHDVLIEPMHG